MPSQSLDKQTVMVTGAAGSLGAAIARGLRKSGCRVLALDRDAAGLDALAKDGIATIACDLLDENAAARCIGEAWQHHGPISVLVNAVGLIHSAPLINIAATSGRKHSLAAWRRVIDLNLTAAFVATVNTVDRMVSTRTRGVVINFSSLAASGNAGQGAYAAAKAGVNAMTTSWAKELGIRGIRFVAIAPGFIDVPSTRAALAESVLNDWVQRTPLHRLGSVEDVISTIVFAIETEYINGKVIEIDGGLTL